MRFHIVGELFSTDKIATHFSIKDLHRLNKLYGRGRWITKRGFAIVKLSTNEEVSAELHWYEAHGIGKREIKIKRILDR